MFRGDSRGSFVSSHLCEHPMGTGPRRAGCSVLLAILGDQEELRPGSPSACALAACQTHSGLFLPEGSPGSVCPLSKHLIFMLLEGFPLGFVFLELSAEEEHGSPGPTPPAPSPRWTWPWTATRQPGGRADLAASCRGHAPGAGRRLGGLEEVREQLATHAGSPLWPPVSGPCPPGWRLPARP